MKRLLYSELHCPLSGTNFETDKKCLVKSLTMKLFGNLKLNQISREKTLVPSFPHCVNVLSEKLVVKI